ncbi:MAG: hypothetical protein AB7F25_04780 [Deferribacterales bacterium]
MKSTFIFVLAIALFAAVTAFAAETKAAPQTPAQSNCGCGGAQQQAPQGK